MKTENNKTMNMKNYAIAIFVCEIVFFFNKGEMLYAQNIGINSTGAAPNTSAMLDIDATNKGLLIPRIALASLTDAVTIPTPANSLLVYNTNAALSGGVGYYYNSGTTVAPAWLKFQTTAIPGVWTAFTPTLRAESGSLTTASATGRYIQIGKTVSFTITITITTNGTAAIWVAATLPVTANSRAVVPGRENAITGSMLQGVIWAGGNEVYILTYNNVYPGGNGRELVVSGTYEAL